MLKGMLREFGRGLIWSTAFLVVYVIGQLLVFGVLTNNGTAQSQDRRVEEQSRAYEEQLKRAGEQQKRTEELLDRSTNYYDRMDANASKQEEINQRIEALVARWEPQRLPATR